MMLFGLTAADVRLRLPAIATEIGSPPRTVQSTKAPLPFRDSKERLRTSAWRKIGGIVLFSGPLNPPVSVDWRLVVGLGCTCLACVGDIKTTS